MPTIVTLTVESQQCYVSLADIFADTVAQRGHGRLGQTDVPIVGSLTVPTVGGSIR